ncbi:MAG: hypothetical protein IKC11_00570 [Clostridia bacterium]|nr:hypothetical protein [Clostridia bacterium]
MESIAKNVYDKVEEVLFIDKLKSPQKINDILSSEILYILKQYFEVKENCFKSRIVVEENGELDISFNFKALRVLIKRGVEVI